MAIDRGLKHLSDAVALGCGGSYYRFGVAAVVKRTGPADWGERAAVVTMVERLVKIGLVRRIPTPADRRKKLLVVSDEGKVMYGKVRTEADAMGKNPGGCGCPRNASGHVNTRESPQFHGKTDLNRRTLRVSKGAMTRRHKAFHF